jgi:hypothetical protein
MRWYFIPRDPVKPLRGKESWKKHATSCNHRGMARPATFAHCMDAALDESKAGE